MPNKSRHNHRGKKVFKSNVKSAPAASAAANPAPVVNKPYQPAAAPRPVSASGKSGVATIQYPFVKKELLWTGILSLIMLVALVVLYLLRI